jgi:hypothetical protein
MILNLVGAAGFEPATSLEFKQGALTAELHAYSAALYIKSTESIESLLALSPSSTRTASASTQRQRAGISDPQD